MSLPNTWPQSDRSTDRSKPFNLAFYYPSPTPSPAAYRVGLTPKSSHDSDPRGMDDPSRQRRHNDSLGQHASSARFGSQPSRSVPSGSNDRYRPAPIDTSPHTPRSVGDSGNYSSYYQEPTSGFSSTSMPSAGIAGYGSDYSQDGRQHPQSFSGYNTAAMMYNVAQPNTQPPVYDAQQFGSRQPAAMQMVTPDVTSTYFGADAANASASSLHPSAHGPSSSTSVYQQNPPMNYTSNMPSVGAVQQAQGSTEVPMNEDPEYSDGALEEKWHNYQRQLAAIFQDIASGSLDSASETLLTISNWLLSQVADLGKCEMQTLSLGTSQIRNSQAPCRVMCSAYANGQQASR